MSRPRSGPPRGCTRSASRSPARPATAGSTASRAPTWRRAYLLVALAACIPASFARPALAYLPLCLYHKHTPSSRDGEHVKITDIRTVVVGNPWKNWVFAQVSTDEGITGLGE